MTTRAYLLARRWTASVLTAGSLGAIALGIHLAQAQTTVTTAQGVTQQTPSGQALVRQEQRQRHGDDGRTNGGDDGGLSSQALPNTGGQNFQPAIPPGNSGIGGPQISTSGS